MAHTIEVTVSDAVHCQRLFAVHARFANIRHKYPTLRWGHFMAVLEWPNPEAWLLRAFEHGWTVSQMRMTRFAER